VVNQVLEYDRGVIKPLVTHIQCLSRDIVKMQDEQGEFYACRLKNRNGSALCNWYVIVSPEDVSLLKDCRWCGLFNVHRGTIEVRRRETLDGKQYSILLTREIWERAHPKNSEPKRIYRLGHTLDFRRQNLSSGWVRDGCRGVIWHKEKKYWQVGFGFNGRFIYIGTAMYPDDGYRMFNRYLRDLKRENPEDKSIQCLPYNKVVPKF